MIPFLPFKMSDRQTRHVVRLTQAAGLVPILVVGSIAAVAPGSLAPALACALGLVLGMEILLQGAYRLHLELPRLTPWGRRLAAHQDAWFPFLLFIVQNAYIIITLLVLWNVVQDVGLRASPLQNITLVMAFFLVPGRRIFEALGRLTSNVRFDFAAGALAPLFVAAVVLFAADTFTAWLGKEYSGIPTQSGDLHSPPILFIWVVTVLLLLGCTALFLGRIKHVFGKRPEA